MQLDHRKYPISAYSTYPLPLITTFSSLVSHFGSEFMALSLTGSGRTCLTAVCVLNAATACLPSAPAHVAFLKALWWLGGLLVERRTSVSQKRGSIPGQALPCKNLGQVSHILI